MKKICAFIILFVIIVNLFSCMENTPENTTTQSQQMEQLDYIYNGNGGICETPTRLIFVNNMNTYYYNKLDGSIYRFCFDPLCKHKSDCISNKFMSFTDQQPLRYRAEDNRLYALRGNQLVSMAFDGSDIKILYSHSDEKQWNEEFYDSMALQYLKLHDDYAYMTIQNEDTGKRELFRYCISDGKMENLMKKTTIIDTIDIFDANGDNIYFWSIFGETYGFYCADMDFQNIRKLSDDDGNGYYPPESLFDGDAFYIPIHKEISKNEFVTKEIRMFDVNIGKETLVCALNIENWIDIFSVTERYLYYTIHDPIVIGQKKTGLGKLYDVKNYQCNVYRYDMETGEHLAVFYDLNYDINSIFLMEDSVLMEGILYTKSGENLTSESHMFVADIDENGMFVNVRILEE